MADKSFIGKGIVYIENDNEHLVDVGNCTAFSYSVDEDKKEMSIIIKLETALLSSSVLSSTIAAAHSMAEDKNPLAAMMLEDLIGDAHDINKKILNLIEAIEQE